MTSAAGRARGAIRPSETGRGLRPRHLSDPSTSPLLPGQRPGACLAAPPTAGCSLPQTHFPHPTYHSLLPSAWGAVWGVGSEGRMTSCAGLSWERGKTEGMEPGTEVVKPGGKFWCRAGCPRPGDTSTAVRQRGAGSPGRPGPVLLGWSAPGQPCPSSPARTRALPHARRLPPDCPRSTDRRNVPPSTGRGCGCGAARGGGQGAGGRPGPRPAGRSAGRSRWRS